MLESLAFRLEIECSACWALLTVPSIVERTACACGESQHLDRTYWCTLIDQHNIANALARKTDDIETRRFVGGSTSRFGFGRRVPRCEQCKAELPLDKIAIGLACPACNVAIDVREADELCRAIVSNARFVVAPAPSRSRLFYLLCEYDQNAQREAQWVKSEVRVEDASTDSLTEDQYRRLAADKDREVRSAIAGNRATPPDILATLATDREEEVRIRLVRNSSTPPEALARMVEDRKAEVRAQLARNPNLPITAFERLAFDKEEDVRKIVLGDARMTTALLAKMAGDREDDMRAKVAKHPLVDGQTLLMLAHDTHYRVRAAVAGNPKSPADALALLVNDSDSDVQREIQNNPVLTPEIIQQLKAGR